LESGWADLWNMAWLGRRFAPQGRPEPSRKRRALSVCIELAAWQLVSERHARCRSEGLRETLKRAEYERMPVEARHCG